MYQAKDEEGNVNKRGLCPDIVDYPDNIYGAMSYGILTVAEARLLLGLSQGEMVEIVEIKNVITEEL